MTAVAAALLTAAVGLWLAGRIPADGCCREPWCRNRQCLAARRSIRRHPANPRRWHR